MPNENFSPKERPEDAGRMNNADAQQEANMARLKMGQNPDTGTVKAYNRYMEVTGQRIPTAEDYDDAIMRVEELKRLVEEQPAIIGPLSTLLRILNKTTETLITYPVALLTSGDLANTTKSHNEIMHWFEDETYRLKQAQKKADEFGKSPAARGGFTETGDMGKAA